MNKTILKNLTMLQRLDTQYPGRWHWISEFSSWHKIPDELMQSGLIEENLDHGLRYRLTDAGRKFDTGFVVNTTTGEVIER